jgi:hypothetical protein
MKPDAEVALIESVGDTGFRIDPTTNNRRPTAYVKKVNGFEVGNAMYGFPLRTKVLPGQVQLELHCMLPNSAGDPRTAPVGLGALHTYSALTMTADLKPGKRYELKCEEAPGYRARFWLDEIGR